MAKIAHKSEIEVDAESSIGSRKRSFRLSPAAKWRAWKALVAISTFFSLYTSSFLASFDSSVTPLVTILYICDAIYLIDTVIRITMCIDSKKENSSWKNKAKLWYPMALDILTLMPLELIAIAAVTPSRPWLHVSRLYRLNRIPRFYRFFAFFRNLENEQGIKLLFTRSVKHTFATMVVLHFIACGWYLLGCETVGLGHAKCFPKTWATGGDIRAVKKSPKVEVHQHRRRRNHGHKNVANGTKSLVPPMAEMDAFNRYLVCLYWSAGTATSTGYGDIHAVADVERLYSIICMLAGIVFFLGTVLGDMGSAITNADGKRSVYKHKLDAIIEYLDQREIKSGMKRVINSFYEYIVPLFKRTAKGLKRMLSLHIKQKTYFPGQILFRENDIGQRLYYVKQGEVQIFKGGSTIPLQSFKEGSYFGEISLVMNLPKPVTACAVSYCEIFTLNRAALKDVVRRFPGEFAVLQSVIEERYQQAEMILDHKIARDILHRDESKERIEGNPKTWRLILQQLYDKLVVPPSSPFYKTWRTIVFGSSLLFFVVHTAIASFKVSFKGLGYGASGGIIFVYAAWYLYDLILVFDILIHVRTATKNHQKGMNIALFLAILVVIHYTFVYIIAWSNYSLYPCSHRLFPQTGQNTKQVMAPYLKSWKFWIDVVSVLPFEIFAGFFPNKRQRWHASTFLRSNRLIRIYHVPQYFNMLEKQIDKSLSLIRSCKLLVYILLTNHMISCIWFLQACFGDNCGVSWAKKAGLEAKHTALYSYIISIYWTCATLTSTGYGDVIAISSRDEIVASISLVVGLLLNGYCVCTIYSTISHLLAPRCTFREHMTAASKFLKELELCSNMRKEVEEYFGVIWHLHKGQSLPGRLTLLDDLPLELQENVAYEQFKDILQSVPLFRDTGEQFQRRISLIAKTILYMPGETIVRIGDMNRNLYIVRRGKAEVLAADRSCVVAAFGPGGYFGEVALLFGESRPSDVRAKTFCEIVIISKKDLDVVLADFLVISKEIEHAYGNILVLQKLQATAHEEAKRSTSTQHMFDMDEDFGIRLSHEKLSCLPREYVRRGSIRYSLPERIRVNSAYFDAVLNPEARRTKIACLAKEEQKEYYARLHPIMKILSKVLMKKCIIPYRGEMKIWALLTAVFCYFYLFLVGIRITFAPQTTFVYVLSYLLDGFFLVDIYIKLHVGFYNEEGILVRCTLKTAEEYLRTSFIFDFLAIIPFDAMMMGYPRIQGYGTLNRLFHLVKLVNYFSFFSSPVGRKYDLMRLIGMSSYLLLLIHYVACLWFFSACSKVLGQSQAQHSSPHGNGTSVQHLTSVMSQSLYKCGETSWARIMKKSAIAIESEKMGVQYIVSVYWAVGTMCVVGYGDIRANLSKERVISCVAMISGTLLFCTVIAYFFASMVGESNLKSKFQNTIDGLKQFFTNQGLKASLGKRVLSHFDHAWHRTSGIDVYKFFKGLPGSMQGSIFFSLYNSMLFSVPCFKDAPAGFIEILAQYVKLLYILKGEYIVQEGDMAREIFFINYGTAEVVPDIEETPVICNVGEGHFFGEVAVLCNKPVYTSIRAQTNVDLFLISKDDLVIVLNNFPQVKEKVVEVVENMKVQFDKQSDNGFVGFDVQKFDNETERKNGEGRVVKQYSINRYPLLSSQPGNEDSKRAVINDNKMDSCMVAVKTQPRTSGLFATLTRWNRFVIKEDGLFGYFRIANAVLVYLTCLTTTFMAIFCEYRLSLLLVTYICEALFLFEMYLKFHLCYTSKNLQVVDNYDLTFDHYLHGEFLFDVVASLPLELFCFAYAPGKRLSRLSYLRLIRWLRMKRVRELFSKWLSKLNINVFGLTLCKNVAEAFAVIHVLSCIWYVLACPYCKCISPSWAAGAHNHSDPKKQYFHCFYWAVATMTSTGYGDITATTFIEMIFSIGVMISGKVIFSCVLSNVTAALASTEEHRSSFEEKLKEVQAYMRDQHIKPSLQTRVVNFFRDSWETTRSIDVSAVLLETPFCLRTEVYVALIGDTVRTIPMFRKCDEPFIRHLCSAAKYSHFCAGEYVIRSGNLDENLYIIRRGEVTGIVEGSGRNVAKSINGAKPTKNGTIRYKDGDFFGEENILKDTPSTLSFRTKTPTDLFIFSKASVHHVIKIFQDGDLWVGLTAESSGEIRLIH